MKDPLRLSKADVKPAAEVLARAFWNYPVSIYTTPDETMRQKSLPHFFQMSLYYCIKYGEIYATSPEMEGIAAWLPSDNFTMTAWKLLRSVPLSVVFNLARNSRRQMKSMSASMALGSYIDGAHKRLAPVRHWFLQTVGVDPGSQGKGYASRLLRPMLARIDAEGLPCYLETLDAQDVPIYEHFGFRVIEESGVPNTDLTNWAMLRKAQ